MALNVMVPKAEYDALKQIAAAAAMRQEEKEVENNPSQVSPLQTDTVQAVDAVNQRVVKAKESAEWNEVLSPGEGSKVDDDIDGVEKEDEQEEKSGGGLGGGGGEEEVGGKGPVFELAFLPPGKRAKARDMLNKLVCHPSVDVEKGIVYVKGKRAGHMFFLLHEIFGDKMPAVKNISPLLKLCRELGLDLGSKRERERREQHQKQQVQPLKKDKKARTSTAKKITQSVQEPRRLSAAVLEHLK